MDLTLNEDVAPELVWVDLETIGLNEREHPIIEAGIIVTDRFGVERARTSSLVGYSKNYLLPRISQENVDPIVYAMHTKNGLFEEVEAACALVDMGHLEYRRPEVERALIEWLDVVTDGPQKYQMAGASIHYDRRFLSAQMPRLETWFHYRNYDVSTILGLAGMAKVKCPYQKRNIHRAIPDIEDEIAVQTWAMQNLVVQAA